MKIEGVHLEFERLASAAVLVHAEVNAIDWITACRAVREQGGRLVALWGSERGAGYVVHAALATSGGLALLTLPVAQEPPFYPGIETIFPSANRMQRAAYDLLGISAQGSEDTRPWLRHAAWPADVFPLRKNVGSEFRVPGSRLESNSKLETRQTDNYPFVQVAGDGVHEIAVGPVHAGTIEPGHFRFSVVGERVLRLEERLGYKHKGIEKLFAGMTLEAGARLAARISGDTTVGYGWAYAMAVESACAVTPPPRALWLRALLLERERIANHLGDLGFIGNDAGLAFGLSQFLILKEDLLRTHAALFGHRYLMDVIVPGGVTRDLSEAGLASILAEVERLEPAVALLKNIYDEHPGLQDRFIACGRVAPELAAQLELCGLAGRASAQAWDWRVEFAVEPYDRLEVRMGTHRNGDVAARVAVRFEEIFESLRLLRLLVEGMPRGEIHAPLAGPRAGALGVGLIEGWRGEIMIAVEAGADGAIARCHPHDPSWQNWPVLEHAVIDNIVPDFPLINKSFNLTYAGHDL
jgi:Ni,Fe-hydrogenase III large subunit/Ni,Fe-hydrogenase III component G